MDQKWILVLAILGFYQKVTSGAYTVETPSEGGDVDLQCRLTDKGSMIIWFRILDKVGMEFIGSFSNNGVLKIPKPLPPKFKEKMNSGILTLTGFKAGEDSGIYGCGSLVGGNKLHFGDAIRLNAREIPGQKPAVVVTTVPNRTVPTTTPCFCPRPKVVNPFMSCPLIILAPLAGGCGFLLLLLIIISLYCNKIRTRRCPHHYKRKPRMMEPGKQMRPNSNI